MSRDHSLIGQLELLAAVAVYFSFGAADFADWEAVHFIDNTSALYSLVKGYSSSPDSLPIIQSFHILNLLLRVGVWFNYVATKANVADFPSRGDLAAMEAALRRFSPSFSIEKGRVPFALPPLVGGLAGLVAAVRAAVPGLSAAGSRKRQRR